jgi:hypothetical protein
MVVVRPLNILASTAGTEVTQKEKLFMSWLAPRGIVAAAVSSLFAQKLKAAGVPGGEQLQALVFLVITTTVVLQGLSGGVIAKALGLTRPNNNGFVILSAGPFARALGKVLKSGGDEVVLIDTNADACHTAEQEGFRVFFGSGLKESIQLRAELSTRAGVLALTPSDSTNLLFTKTARKAHKVHNAWASLQPRSRVTDHMLHEFGVQKLGKGGVDINRWNALLSRGQAQVEAWVAGKPPKGEATEQPAGVLLLAAGKSGGRMRPLDEGAQPRAGETVWVLIADDAREAAEGWLGTQQFTQVQAAA